MCCHIHDIVTAQILCLLFSNVYVYMYFTTVLLFISLLLFVSTLGHVFLIFWWVLIDKTCLYICVALAKVTVFCIVVYLVYLQGGITTVCLSCTRLITQEGKCCRRYLFGENIYRGMVQFLNQRFRIQEFQVIRSSDTEWLVTHESTSLLYFT